MSEPEQNIHDQLSTFLLGRFPQLDRAGLERDDSLLDNGALDSLGILELVTFMEGAFSIKVDDMDLVPDNFDKPSTLVSYVISRQ